MPCGAVEIRTWPARRPRVSAGTVTARGQGADAAGGVGHHHPLADVEIVEHGGQVLGVGLDAEAGASQGGLAVAAQVVGDDLVAGGQQRLPQQRPGLQRQQRPVGQHQRPAGSGGDRVQLPAVTGGDPVRRAA
jgi:hypothetical protein